ncbi:AAA family ATPase [Mesorhizobium sp. L48C026A00]|uniref:AAA family ATPase n=1 Tax=Mesorhizobium sp. L48C026A00 TaxID=1287182 RepID=UPI0003CFCFDA|nr:AAA family ATPase [Mesorhizobium sp. L48C026A00]ESZ02358.1 hypothetical protein X737_38415 [Mesorhizobium sp. L48C026A00]
MNLQLGLTPSCAFLPRRHDRTIERNKIDFVCLDPFVKTHGLTENDNNQMDQVIEFLANFAIEMNIAVDVPHHTAKGAANPGNADRGRGASAIKDGARLVYTLTTMSDEEAERFGVPPADRRLYIRMDSGKVNITPPAAAAKRFKLVSVVLGNGNHLYPDGDNVQTIEQWTPPETWEGLTDDLVNRILTDIDAGMADGERYSDAGAAKARAAWKVVQKRAPKKTEQQCREIIATWVKNGLILKETYYSLVTRKDREGLHVDDMKRGHLKSPLDLRHWLVVMAHRWRKTGCAIDEGALRKFNGALSCANCISRWRTNGTIAQTGRVPVAKSQSRAILPPCRSSRTTAAKISVMVWPRA